MTDVPGRVFDYLDAVDAAAPGVLHALYLTGSIALGDYVPGVSDIDLVAIMPATPTADQVGALRGVHESHGERPFLDVTYLTDEQFAARPVAGEVVPHSTDGVFHHDQSAGQLNPVTWAELSRHGITVRGVAPTLTIDDQALRAWNRGNLAGYWAALAAEAHGITGARHATDPIDSATLVWAVLGPPRLHYTIMTGEVVSKTAAGRYAASIFPDWADLIDRCVRARHGEAIATTVTDLASAADFVDAVIRDIS